jgi:hypothetical protein
LFGYLRYHSEDLDAVTITDRSQKIINTKRNAPLDPAPGADEIAKIKNP